MAGKRSIYLQVGVNKYRQSKGPCACKSLLEELGKALLVYNCWVFPCNSVNEVKLLGWKTNVILRWWFEWIKCLWIVLYHHRKINCVCVQLRIVPPAQPCSNVGENGFAGPIWALFPAPAESSAAKPAGLHHGPAAWLGGGPGSLRQVHVRSCMISYSGCESGKLKCNGLFQFSPFGGMLKDTVFLNHQIFHT